MPGEPSVRSPFPHVQGSGHFSATHWSVVLQAGAPDGAGATEALEKRCLAYWYPVYAWIRSQGRGPEEAEDLTQEFFATLLRRDSLRGVAQERGRFRTWLIRSIQYFLTDHYRAESAAKRGGGARVIEWDGLDPAARYALEPGTEDAPDTAFDRRWCQVLMARAFQRREAEEELRTLFRS